MQSLWCPQEPHRLSTSCKKMHMSVTHTLSIYHHTHIYATRDTHTPFSLAMAGSSPDYAIAQPPYDCSSQCCSSTGWKGATRNVGDILQFQLDQEQNIQGIHMEGVYGGSGYGSVNKFDLYYDGSPSPTPSVTHSPSLTTSATPSSSRTPTTSPSPSSTSSSSPSPSSTSSSSPSPSSVASSSPSPSSTTSCTPSSTPSTTASYSDSQSVSSSVSPSIVSSGSPNNVDRSIASADCSSRPLTCDGCMGTANEENSTANGASSVSCLLCIDSDTLKHSCVVFDHDNNESVAFLSPTERIQTYNSMCHTSWKPFELAPQRTLSSQTDTPSEYCMQVASSGRLLAKPVRFLYLVLTVAWFTPFRL